MKLIRSSTVLFVAVFASQAFCQGDPNTVDRIVNEGKNHNQVMKRLRELTNIGPRVTSSPTLLKAQHWAMGQFKRYGLKNVHLEQYGTAPVGFDRGPTQIGRMVSPFVSEFQFTTLCWTPGTKGLVKAKAVIAPKTLEEFEQVKDKLKGAWVLTPGGWSMRGPSIKDDELKKAIDSVGIAGRIFSASDERVHTNGKWVDKTFDKRPTDINIGVRKSDFDRVERNIRFGRDVQLEFNLDNRWYKGPVPLYNVVADLPGTEKPDEFVIVSGHLDSWNGPGSQGACDNGTGSCVAVEAARILSRAHAKPKRTIRFVLWSGEEQGLLGSTGYVKDHKSELDKISAVLVDDGGTGYQGGYAGIESMKAMMEEAFAPTAKAFPLLPMEFAVSKNMPAGGGSDHAPFNGVGVPGFFTMEKGEKANYGRVWHTQYDRYEEAVPEYLVQSSTNHAVVSYNLACAATLLPRAEKKSN